MITALAVGAAVGVAIFTTAFVVVVVFGPGLDAAHFGFCTT